VFELNNNMNFLLPAYILFPLEYNFDLLIKNENIEKFSLFHTDHLPTVIRRIFIMPR
jgi:hypothetical protein